MLRRYRALVAYDGAAYLGFQRQRKGQPTIQGTLEQVLSKLAGRPLPILGAGRTDSGVHATGQTISFEMDWKHPITKLQSAINAYLPQDIVVRDLQETENSFHPRFDAYRRAYKYYIYNTAVRSPIHRNYSWHVRRSLDVEMMHQAAQSLIGVHDFATFGQPPQGINTVREVTAVSCQQEGEMVTISIEANAFLQRMVRSIVGSLKQVGEGMWTIEELVDAFQACERSRCGTVAPPQGLFLIAVTYEW